MKYYGQFNNPKVDEYLHKEFFLEKKDGVFIECGAADGILESSCKIFSLIGWTGINIEPNPTLFKDLIINRPECVNLNYALTSNEKEGELYYAEVVFTDHISKLRKRKTTGRGCVLNSKCLKEVELDPILQINSNIKVPSISYNSLVLKYNITQVDLLVLDVEGSETDVISGMYGAKILPKIICVEVEPTGIENLISMLGKLNYYYYSTIHTNAHFILKK